MTAIGGLLTSPPTCGVIVFFVLAKASLVTSRLSSASMNWTFGSLGVIALGPPSPPAILVEAVSQRCAGLAVAARWWVGRW